MSESTALPADNDTDEEAVESASYRRPLQVAALGLAVGSLILIISDIGQAYAGLQLTQSINRSFGADMRWLASQLADPFVVLIALLAIAAVAAIRCAWPDEESRNKTVVSATIALCVALIVLVATVYDIVSTLTGDGRVADTGAARFARISQDLFNITLSAIALWIGSHLASNVRDEEDAEDDPTENATATEQ